MLSPLSFFFSSYFYSVLFFLSSFCFSASLSVFNFISLSLSLIFFDFVSVFLPLPLPLLQVLKNPIVFMVVVGLASHFALGQKIPLVLVQFIDGLADSFGGAALFYLGLTMVGEVSPDDGHPEFAFRFTS